MAIFHKFKMKTFIYKKSSFFRAKMDSSKHTEPVPTVRRKLTVAHLNNDCLEKVFSYLNLTDLTNVAESNVHLAVSAQNLFAHLYKLTELKYNCYDNQIIEDTFLLALQHFGKCIVKLRVTLKISDEDCAIFDSIIENCRETISELAINGIRTYMIFNKPFPNLKTLELEKFYNFDKTDRSIFDICRWFPYLSCLRVHNVAHFWETTSIVRHFPTLQTFGCYMYPNLKHTPVSLGKLAQFLQLNPQLKCLELDELESKNINADFYDKCPLVLPNIERLVVVPPHPFPNGPIRFDKLNELNLSIYKRDSFDVFENLPQTIECFELRIINVNSVVIDYILGCKNLKKLRITAYAMEEGHMERLAKEMQSLTQVQIMLEHSTELMNHQTLAGMEHFFLYGQQLKAFTFESKLESFEADCEIDKKIGMANKFTNYINESMKSNWRMSHDTRDNEEDYRSKELFDHPNLRLSFKNSKTY